MFESSDRVVFKDCSDLWGRSPETAFCVVLSWFAIVSPSDREFILCDEKLAPCSKSVQLNSLAAEASKFVSINRVFTILYKACCVWGEVSNAFLRRILLSIVNAIASAWWFYITSLISMSFFVIVFEGTSVINTKLCETSVRRIYIVTYLEIALLNVEKLSDWFCCWVYVSDYVSYFWRNYVQTRPGNKYNYF